MRIVSMTLTRNDADVIEAFVRHHAAFVERMLVFVHRCSDNTREILDGLVAEGLPLDVASYDAADGQTADVRRITDDTGMHRVSALFSRTLVDVAERHAPDFVLPIDSDEFLTTSDGQSLDEALDGLSTTKGTALGWKTYVPTSLDDVAETNVLRRVQHRRDRDDARFTKIVCPFAIARERNAVLTSGNHHVIDRDTARPFDEEPARGLHLAHFPIRTEAQLRAKILSGHLSLTASPVRGVLDGFHWRRLYPRCKDVRPMSMDELSEIGRLYGWAESAFEPRLVRDPVKTSSGEQRYAVRPLEPWSILADNAEHLANEVHRLARDRLDLEEKIRSAMKG